jgi:transketolase
MAVMINTLPVTKMAGAIRALAMDAIQKANSGHPGMPMGMAEIAVALWAGHYRHNPANPTWFNRDRFILSNGHGSMLHYALLHLTGYDVSIDDLKNFRQFGSKTPGHPEVHVTPGIDTTTGPLGQGITNAVGMALAEKLLAQEFNRKDFNLVDHYTYVFMGDGCMMEGISHEACSLAGTWKLNKLIAFYDDNGISIDGDVKGWLTDDTQKRFESYGWNVIANVNGHDAIAIDAAITKAKASDKPTLIICKTVIGKGSPNKAGLNKIHGAPLGDDEIALTRKAIDWPYPAFEIPADVYQAWDAKASGTANENAWNALLNAYTKQYPQEAAEFSRRIAGQLPEVLDKTINGYVAECQSKKEKIATRKASQNAINALAPVLPEFLGGSADLTGSNLTNWTGCVPVREGKLGNYISYGVREFGMAAIMNGVVLHGGYLPFGGTFLTFSDYCRNAIRMSALMRIGTIYVFTHDSIGVGEDGPTHQPVEHVASMRLIPGLTVWRPCDTVETAVAWGCAVKSRHEPSVLALTRQGLPCFDRTPEQVAAIQKGGYVLRDIPNAKVVLIATGSEVALAMDAAEALAQKGIGARVVSMPSTTLFDRQDAAYQESVLPKELPRIAIEAGTIDTWYKYTGLGGAVIGMTSFGDSAPAGVLFKHFGFTVENVVAKAELVLDK